jgi:PAS domain S-box-containing protein
MRHGPTRGDEKGPRRRTRAKKQSAPRRLQEDLLRALDESSEGAILVSSDQRILSWNRAAEELLGIPRSEALGGRCYALIAGRVAGREWCRPSCAVWSAVRSGHRMTSFDLLTHTSDGQQVWVNVAPLVLRQREGTFALHLLRDISRRVRFERLMTRLLQVFERYSALPQPPSHGHARGPDSGGATAPDENPLTAREVEVLRCLSLGLSTRAIAQHLGISHHTVSNHVRNALQKAGLHSRAEAVSFAIRNGLV